MARFAVGWEVKLWGEDGLVRCERGEELLEADDATSARRAVEAQVSTRFAGAPHELRSVVDGERSPRYRHRGPPPPSAKPPDHEALRARVREGEAPAAVVLGLRGEGLTPLSIMLAFEDAFGLGLDELEEIPALCAGGEQTSAAERLASRVAGLQRRWDRPFRLRRARERGESVVDLLHAELASEGRLRLLVSLREAFHLRLPDAMDLMEGACNRDPDFAARLEDAIRRGGGAGPGQPRPTG